MAGVEAATVGVEATTAYDPAEAQQQGRAALPHCALARVSTCQRQKGYATVAWGSW
ncbi:MAG: hypothetical protein WC718_17900 [Phycisphaerales bacterium]